MTPPAPVNLRDIIDMRLSIERLLHENLQRLNPGDVTVFRQKCTLNYNKEETVQKTIHAAFKQFRLLHIM